MDILIFEFCDHLADQLLNPQKRIFIGYLASALIIAIGVQFISAKITLRRSIASIFSTQIWWSRSARADYMIAGLNQAIMMGVGPRLISNLIVATVLFETLHVFFDGRPQYLVAAPDWTIATLFTLGLFLIDDSTKYFLHRYLHNWPILWCFHKIHHTAETLTPFTVFRTHPIEGILFAFRSILVQATAMATFFFFLGDRVELLTVFGANMVLFVFNLVGSNLRHSHVWISYGQLIEHFLISPAQHQIHHSVEQQHSNRNFGAVLAIWDWIGGSLFITGPKRKLFYGLRHPKYKCHGLKAIYLDPIWEAMACIYRLFLWRPKYMAYFRNNKLGWLRNSTSVIFGLTFLFELMPNSASAGELNIYSHRQPFLINPFIEAYEEQTGTKINIVFASKGLAQRLQSEGSRSPADIVLTVDIARLHIYADKGLLAPVQSDILKNNVPAHLRDPESRWFAFSKRARVIVAAKSGEEIGSIKRYEDLTDPRWKGRICVRPGSHVYNRALVASFIESQGEEAAQAWAQGVVDNLARRPQGNDRAQVKAIYEGVCDVAIINNYYYGKLKGSDIPEQREWASVVRLIFPNQDDRGTHVNISGGGVARHSKNKEEAIKFLEFLTSKTAQTLYGTINYEYPVNPSVQASSELKSWGIFKEDQMPIARIAHLAPIAQRIIDRVGW